MPRPTVGDVVRRVPAYGKFPSRNRPAVTENVDAPNEDEEETKWSVLNKAHLIFCFCVFLFCFFFSETLKKVFFSFTPKSVHQTDAATR